MAFKKKLYQYRPITDWTIETQRTLKRTRAEPCDPASVERGVRQLLANKVSGNLVGLWLLIPEHLRLGTWDLLCGWSGQSGGRVEPRLALQLVHEAALCLTGTRQQRSLSQRGFELAHGLPFVASDVGVHSLLADLEHFSVELFDHVQLHTPFDLMVPMKNQKSRQRQLRGISPEQFTRRWAGYATAKLPYQMARSAAEPIFQFAQRTGEQPNEYRFQSFLATTDRDEVEAMTLEYPKRWHVEEFFNANQTLGWARAGTLNLNIRYGQMTMAIIAQAVLNRLRHRLGEPYDQWDANHLARSILAGLEGDVRVHDDTILVTYYNAPNAAQLREHYEGLPHRLAAERVDPHIPWLYGYKLDFRFR
jgi:hypothetical protein